MFREIRNTKTRIGADIPCTNLNPDRYTEPIPAIVYVRNYVPIPINSMTTQMVIITNNIKKFTASARELHLSRFEIYGSALEHDSISSRAGA